MPAHPHMRAPALAAAGALPVPGSGSGSLPGLVLFESGLTGMGCEHTRSAIRTAPLRYPDPNRSANGPAPLQLDSQQLRWLGRTIATVQTEPLQLFVGFGPVGPSRSAICNGSDRTVATFR